MPFTKGHGGRPKGAQNKRTPEVSGWCRKLVEDKDYRKSLNDRLKAGDCAPAVEAMIWHYAYGKPVESHEMVDADGQTVGSYNFIIQARV